MLLNANMVVATAREGMGYWTQGRGGGRKKRGFDEKRL